MVTDRGVITAQLLQELPAFIAKSSRKAAKSAASEAFGPKRKTPGRGRASRMVARRGCGGYSAASLKGSGGVQRRIGVRAARVSSRRRRGA